MSVIIPSYNHGHYVLEAVESVLCQTFAHAFEVIVIDDGSRDDSRAILTARYGEDPRVRLEFQTNRGISGTFNRGLELARAELVGFCCSDDRWRPGHLQASWDNLEAHPEAVVSFGRAQAIDQSGALREDIQLFGTITDPNPFAQLLLKGNSLCFVAALFRREVALEAGGFDQALGVLQDYDLWLKLLRRGSAAYLLEPSVDFRWDGGNASGRKASVQKRRDTIHILGAALEDCPLLREDLSLREVARARLADAHLRLARRLPDKAQKLLHLREARRLGIPAWRQGYELLKAYVRGS